MAENTNWKYLLEKFTSNTCTKEELDQFLKLVQQDEDNENLKSALRKHWENAGSKKESSAAAWQKFSSLINEAQHKALVVPMYSSTKKQFVKWAAAASVLILLSLAAYYRFQNNHDSRSEIYAAANSPIPQGNEVTPGRSKALLTLADGSVINLDSAKKGTLINQGNIKIIKIEDGELLYFDDHQPSTADAYNTITIPRGGKYKVVLADGSKVWLNAASSLKFPIAFNNSTRNVTLTGEGYFEVAKNELKPFYVNVNDMLVKVLGTHFNINAYQDEIYAATTLLEGSVKVTKGYLTNTTAHSMLLKPGEQSLLSKGGALKKNHHANTAEAVAWKNDRFEFNNTSVDAIMRQISRWYNVEIEYRGAMPTQMLTGKIGRNVNLSQFIEMLTYTGVNMKIENQKLIIWINKKK